MFNAIYRHNGSIAVPHSIEYIGQTLVQVMACRLFGVKPLPEPLLIYCKTLANTFQWKVNQNIKIFNSWNCIWKCRPQNGGHIAKSSMCWGGWYNTIPPTSAHLEAHQYSATSAFRTRPYTILLACTTHGNQLTYLGKSLTDHLLALVRPWAQSVLTSENFH